MVLIRLATDPVYVLHFKCNTGSVRHDYPELNRWMKNLYWKHPAFKDTTEYVVVHFPPDTSGL